MTVENDTAPDWRSEAAYKSDRSHPKSSTFKSGLPDDRAFWTRLADLAAAAAGRCRRRGDGRKAAWFTGQARKARERSNPSHHCAT